MEPLRDQLDALSDVDLCRVFLAARKLLKKRRLLERVQRVISNQVDTAHVFSPDKKIIRQEHTFARGKLNRNKNQSFLFDMLDDDWGHLFTEKYDEERKYYVYYHAYPNVEKTIFSNGEEKITFVGKPFYVGKGCGNRYKSRARSRSHLSVIKRIELDYGAEGIFHIFKDGLTEKEALELEAKLITFFGCEAEISKKSVHIHGFQGGWLLNSDPAVRPEYMNKLIKVRGVSLKD